MKCPFCHDEIASPAAGVACRKCGTAHHSECWTDYGKCTIQGCGSTESGPIKAFAAARRAIAIGRTITREAYEAARERFGGKSTVGLFVVTATVVGLGAAPLLYGVHASTKVDIELVLGGLFLLLWIWIATLVYRGATLEDDLDVQIAARTPADYYSKLGGGSDLSGCGSLDGCGSGGASDLEGILGGVIAIVAILIIIFVVLPFVAWIAVEVVFPFLVLVVYGVLYHALAFAVNSDESQAGDLGRALLRGFGFAFFYTALVAVVIGAFVGAFHGGLPAVPRF